MSEPPTYALPVSPMCAETPSWSLAPHGVAVAYTRKLYYGGELWS